MKRFLAGMLAAQTLTTSTAGAQPATPVPTIVADSESGRRAAMVAAEEAFIEGRRLQREGKPRDACESFVESQRLCSSTATLLNLGNCYQAGHLEGGLLGAWRSFSQALAEVWRVPDERAREGLRAEATRRLDGVMVILPTLKLWAPSTPGTLVWLDGAAVPARGIAMAVNPGRHRLELRAPGRRPFSRDLEFKEGHKFELQLPELAPVDESRFGSTPLWLAAAGLVLGGLWASTAINSSLDNDDYSEQLDRCNAQGCDDGELRRLNETRVSARAYAVAADYVFAPATLLTLGTAGILWTIDQVSDRDPSPPAAGVAGAYAGCSTQTCLFGAQGVF